MAVVCELPCGETDSKGRRVPRDPAGTVPARAHPVFKWAGGKRWLAPRLAPEIAARLANYRKARYFEPFLGGGAIALWLGASRMVLSDVEAPLIEAYVAIRDETSAVIAALKALLARGTARDAYLSVRDSAPRGRCARAARMIYLNRLCFNGLYRTNSRGWFNVPYGDYANPSFPSAMQLADVADGLRAASLTCADFEAQIATAGSSDVIFADPPYHSENSGFRSYHQQPFTADDHARLAAALRAAHARGATVYSTNGDTTLVRRLYSWANIVPTSERRAINSVGSRRAGVGCVLITTTHMKSADCTERHEQLRLAY